MQVVVLSQVSSFHHFQPTVFPPDHQETNYGASHYHYLSYHWLPSLVIFCFPFQRTT